MYLLLKALALASPLNDCTLRAFAIAAESEDCSKPDLHERALLVPGCPDTERRGHLVVTVFAG